MTQAGYDCIMVCPEDNCGRTMESRKHGEILCDVIWYTWVCSEVSLSLLHNANPSLSFIQCQIMLVSWLSTCPSNGVCQHIIIQAATVLDNESGEIKLRNFESFQALKAHVEA